MEQTSQHLESGATERVHISRRRARDGSYYTEEEFAEHYGSQYYLPWWNHAYRTQQSMQLDVNPRADPQRAAAEPSSNQHQ